QFRDRAFHHPGQVLQRAANRDPSLGRFEFALEFLNLPEALRDNLGVLFVKLLKSIGLSFVVVQVLFERREFFGVMSAIGLIVRRSGRLQQSLQVLALAVLTLDLIAKQRDLARQLAIGIVRLVG